MRMCSVIRYEVLFLLKAYSLVEGEPRDVIGVELVGDKGLCTIVIGLVLSIQVDNEENVLPQVVLLLDMVHETVLGVLVNLHDRKKFRKADLMMGALTDYLSIPQMKQMFLMSSSICAFSSRRPAKVSMMIPKMMLKKRTMMISMNERSFRARR